MTSASKIVFIMLAVTACFGFLFKRLDPSDFMMLASMAFAFYFSYKSDNKDNAPYNGK